MIIPISCHLLTWRADKGKPHTISFFKPGKTYGKIGSRSSQTTGFLFTVQDMYGAQLPHLYYFTTPILVLKFTNKGVFFLGNPGFAFS